MRGLIFAILVGILSGCARSRLEQQYPSPNGQRQAVVKFADGDQIIGVRNPDGSELIELKKFPEDVSCLVTWRGESRILVQSSREAPVAFDLQANGQWKGSDPLTLSSPDNHYTARTYWGGDSRTLFVSISESATGKVIQNLNMGMSVDDLIGSARWVDNRAIAVQAGVRKRFIVRNPTGEWKISD